MSDAMTNVLDPFLAEADAVLDGRYSAVLYGSAARGDYLPNRSDVNLLLLVENATPPVLHSLARGFAVWRKATPEPPLLMTRLEWTRATDAFPIEITDMKTAYRVLRGPDPIQPLRVDRADLRRALEREFRGKVVRLRQSYAALGSDPAALGAVASGTASSVLVLFRVLLVFLGRPVPSDPIAVATDGAAIVGGHGEALAHVVRHRRERAWRCSAQEFEAYVQVVAQATDFLDQHSRRRVMQRLLPLLVAMPLLAGCGYNTMQSMDERVNPAQGQVQAQLQRRADLVPNLVATVKGVAQQETTVYTRLADARARLSGAVQSGNVGQMAQANAALSQGLGRLLAIVENYPELRSSESFQQLQVQLEGTENRISVARQDYNTAVGEFNGYVRRFPNNVTAKVFGLSRPREYFQAEGEAQNAPQVKF